MAFDNHYARRNDWRRPYRKSKRFDRSCRLHGICDWCRGNRLHNNRKRQLAAEYNATEDSD